MASIAVTIAATTTLVLFSLSSVLSFICLDVLPLFGKVGGGKDVGGFFDVILVGGVVRIFLVDVLISVVGSLVVAGILVVITGALVAGEGVTTSVGDGGCVLVVFLVVGGLVSLFGDVSGTVGVVVCE